MMLVRLSFSVLIEDVDVLQFFSESESWLKVSAFREYRSVVYVNYFQMYYT